MCNISDKIIFCSCQAASPETLRHYWVLHRYNKNKEEFTMGMPFFPDEELYNFDHEKNKATLEKRLNEAGALDIDVPFKAKDRFEIVLNNLHSENGQRVTYNFNFLKGRWRIDEADCYFDTMNNFDPLRHGKIKGVRSTI